MSFRDTGLWADVRELPDTLARSPEGVAAAAALLRGAERIVATGNGAAYYVAHALWLASLETAAGGPPIVAVPAGFAAREGFAWRPGDVVLAVSSSGEFRDVVTIAAGGRPCVAVTAQAGSSLAAASDAVVLQHVAAQRAVTHTQALCGAYAAALAVWAEVTGDGALERVVARAPDAAAHAVSIAEAWDPPEARPVAAVAAGGGTAWAAALELALMLKEIARVPAEGVETREGATSAMFGLAPGHLMVSLDPPGEIAAEEALRLCAAAGATTLQLPAPDADGRLAPIATLPAAAALAASLALAGGHDVDRPAWTDAYYATAR